MSSESEEDFLSADEGGNDSEDGICDNSKPIQNEKNLQINSSTKEEGSNISKHEVQTMEEPEKSMQIPHTEPKVQSPTDNDALRMKTNNNEIEYPKDDDIEQVTDLISTVDLDCSKLKSNSDLSESSFNALSSSNSSSSSGERCKQGFKSPQEMEELETLSRKSSNLMKCEGQDGVLKDEHKHCHEAEQLETSNLEASKTKPLKESKIIIKKPRERLGERLGPKRLGVRINPLEGISYDSFQLSKESIDKGNILKRSDSGQESPQVAETEVEQKSDAATEECTKEENIGWVSWSGLGASLLKAATTLTNEVSKGVETVIETGLQAPDPMELARETVEREKRLKEEAVAVSQKEEDLPSGEASLQKGQNIRKDDGHSRLGFGFASFESLVTGVSEAIETASSKVLLGGLDTLEMIGRRTMDILQEGDPGLRKKRNFLSANKPNLSQTLREARERAIAEEEKKCVEGAAISNKKSQVSLSLAWDNTEGPVHLEALSLVAKQCQGKTNTLLHDLPAVWVHRIQDKIAEIRGLASVEDEKTDNIQAALMNVTRDVQLPLQFNKVLTGWPALQESLSKLSIEICGLGASNLTSIQMDLYQEMTSYVAQVVGVAHKAAEVALITSDLDATKLAFQFQRICGYVSGGLEESADEVCESISKSLPASDPEFNSTITNIYVQIAELNSYLELSLTNLNQVLVYMKAKIMARELGD